MSLDAIVPWSELAAAGEAERRRGELDRVFFEASTVQAFASEAARAAFRHRWLGQYLADSPELVLVALGRGGAVAGYLAGSLTDPVRLPAFAEVSAVAAFADESAVCPAHLHINVASAQRSAGIGAHLVDAFAQRLKAIGAAGFHAVTAAASRNVAFYARQGFRETARRSVAGRDLVFLVRDV